MACRLVGAKPLSEPNAGILLIWPLWTNFSDIFIRIQSFSFQKMNLKMSSAKWRPSCPGLNVLTSALKTLYDRMDISGRYCRIWSDPNKVFVHYGTIISWSCHNGPKFCYYRAQIDKIVPIACIVSITALPVSRAFVELCFLGRIWHSKFERFIVFDHCTVTAAQTHVIFHISKDKYTNVITDLINCWNCPFSHFADSESGLTSEIWKVVHCFGALNHDRCTQMCDIWIFIYLKKNNLV